VTNFSRSSIPHWILCVLEVSIFVIEISICDFCVKQLRVNFCQQINFWVCSVLWNTWASLSRESLKAKMVIWGCLLVRREFISVLCFEILLKAADLMLFSLAKKTFLRIICLYLKEVLLLCSLSNDFFIKARSERSKILDILTAASSWTLNSQQ